MSGNAQQEMGLTAAEGADPDLPPPRTPPGAGSEVGEAPGRQVPSRLELPRPLGTASNLDVGFACPGSREVVHVEGPETPAMAAGLARGRVLQAWVEAGCPAQWPSTVELVPRNLAPIEKLPKIFKHPDMPAVAEVQMWLDPVWEKAGIICIGRRPRKEEYPPGAHIVCGGPDAVGLVEGVPTVVEWKGRTRTVWQVKHAMTAAWLIMGRPTRFRGIEFFHPSAVVEKYDYGHADFEVLLASFRLHAQEVLAQRAGYPPRFNSGIHCRYCRAFHNCPIQEKAVEFRSAEEKWAWTKRK